MPTNAAKFDKELIELGLLDGPSKPNSSSKPTVSQDIPNINQFYNFLRGSSKETTGFVGINNSVKLNLSHLFFIDVLIDQPESVFNINNEYNNSIRLSVQTIGLPNIDTDSDATPGKSFQKIILNNDAIKVDSNILVVGLLSTDLSLHEKMFLQWMSEVNANIYSYDNFPYTTATIIVNVLDQSGKNIMYRYAFRNAYPKAFESMKLEYGTPANFSRQISFNFDYMEIETF
jgi:hypothetical protein